MSRFGNGWISSGRLQQAKDSGGNRHVGVANRRAVAGRYSNLRSIHITTLVGSPSLAH
jgi:hypothetical protein